jgi:SET and MYND domain-containing protein
MVLRTEAKKNAYTQEELLLFQTLETHLDDILKRNAPQAQRIALTSKAVKEYSTTDMEDEKIVAYHARVSSIYFHTTNVLLMPLNGSDGCPSLI